MPLRRDWSNVTPSHVVRVLLVLSKAKKEGRAVTVIQLINDSGIRSSTFYATLRWALEKCKLIAFEVDREHRVIYVKLTERGRKPLCASRSLAWQRVSGLLRKRVKDDRWSWRGVEARV